jgi:Uncharacterized protein conserved in bacteria (DUF2219)
MKTLLLSALLCLCHLVYAQNSNLDSKPKENSNRIEYEQKLPAFNAISASPQVHVPVLAFNSGRRKQFLPDTIALPTLENEQIDPGNFSIHIDQDFLFFFPKSRNQDRNYTQGTAFTYSHPNLIHTFFFYPVKKIAFNKVNRSESKKPYSSAFAIGATAFTPLKIDSANPIIGDRPFSFLFFLSTSTTYSTNKTAVRNKRNGNATKVHTIYHTWNINYGMFGTRLGYEFQSFAHKKIVVGRPIDPKGWTHQISAGGRPTILLEYNRFKPLFSWDLDTEEKPVVKRLFDVGWNIGGSVGYYDRIFSGFYARIGLLKAYNQARWNGGFSSLTGASYQKMKQKKVKNLKPEVFMFGRFNSTLMLRNSMLMGQRFFKSTYTMEPSWVKTILWEYEWGLVAAVEHTRKNERSPRTWAFVFRTVYRSPEFDSGLFPVRRHYFGSAGILFPVF